MTSMEERERCYLFILSRTPHEIFWFHLMSDGAVFVFLEKFVQDELTRFSWHYIFIHTCTFRLFNFVHSLSSFIGSRIHSNFVLLRIYLVLCHHHHHLQPTNSPLLDIELFNIAILLDHRLLASNSCQPFCANRHSTWPKRSYALAVNLRGG
jgi:membrane-bound acyltransferase YfiQ involved in biofilm formation